MSDKAIEVIADVITCNAHNVSDDAKANHLVAERVVAALSAARIAVVELPEPTDGPDGEGQILWHTDVAAISARPDGRVWEEDFDMEPHQAQENAAALLAAAEAVSS